MRTMERYRGLVSLVALTVLLPVAIYRFALKKTADLWIAYARDRRTFQNAAEHPLSEETGGASAADVLTDGKSLPDSVFALAAEQGCVVERYTPRISLTQGGITLYTSEAVISGTYIPLVRTLERIERRIPFCRVVSADYRLVRQPSEAGAGRLYLTLLLRSVVRTVVADKTIPMNDPEL